VIRGEIEKHLAGRVATVSIRREAGIVTPDAFPKTICGINQTGNSTFEMPANRFMHAANKGVTRGNPKENSKTCDKGSDVDNSTLRGMSSVTLWQSK